MRNPLAFAPLLTCLVSSAAFAWERPIPEVDFEIESWAEVTGDASVSTLAIPDSWFLPRRVLTGEDLGLARHTFAPGDGSLEFRSGSGIQCREDGNAQICAVAGDLLDSHFRARRAEAFVLVAPFPGVQGLRGGLITISGTVTDRERNPALFDAALVIQHVRSVPGAGWVAPGPVTCPTNLEGRRSLSEFTCGCPPLGDAPPKVWGTDLYTIDSDVCAAAVHAGVIGPEGGPVAVLPKGGSLLFKGSVRNGVTSLEYEPGKGSFQIEPAEEPPPFTMTREYPGPCITTRRSEVPLEPWLWTEDRQLATWQGGHVVREILEHVTPLGRVLTGSATWTYDDEGRVVRREETWDGHVTRVELKMWDVTAIKPDTWTPPVTPDEHLHEVELIEHDAQGREIATTILTYYTPADVRRSHWTVSYDADGRRVTPIPARVTTDDQGRVIREEWPKLVRTHRYDAAGHLVETHTREEGKPGAERRQTWTWDEYGNPLDARVETIHIAEIVENADGTTTNVLDTELRESSSTTYDYACWGR